MKIEPTIKQVTPFIVSGITVRTINRDEFNPSVAKLGAHWGRFHSQGLAEKIPHRLEDASIYGVYSNYESDVHGHYNVTAGVAVSLESIQSDFISITIDAGNYLVFEAKGPMPQTVVDVWQNIWTYLQDNPQVQRKYTTDFERYQGTDGIAIYIGIK